MATKKYFLLKDKTNGLALLSIGLKAGSHLMTMIAFWEFLKILKYHINEHYLFSVFEKAEDKTSLIYYRAQVKEAWKTWMILLSI